MVAASLGDRDISAVDVELCTELGLCRRGLLDTRKRGGDDANLATSVHLPNSVVLSPELWTSLTRPCMTCDFQRGKRICSESGLIGEEFAVNAAEDVGSRR